MLLKQKTKTRVLLIRPGATEFDDQGRMKGSLDMPLSETGQEQAIAVAEELSGVKIKSVFTAPCESAVATAAKICQNRDLKARVIDCFRNVDHGLWHGKLIDEVKRNQPRVYRCGQETPSEICPPGGESIAEAKERVIKALTKIVRKGRSEVTALVIPDPLASVVEGILSDDQMENLWTAETDTGQWKLIETSKL